MYVPSVADRIGGSGCAAPPPGDCPRARPRARPGRPARARERSGVRPGRAGREPSRLPRRPAALRLRASPGRFPGEDGGVHQGMDADAHWHRPDPGRPAPARRRRGAPVAAAAGRRRRRRRLPGRDARRRPGTNGPTRRRLLRAAHRGRRACPSPATEPTAWCTGARYAGPPSSSPSAHRSSSATCRPGSGSAAGPCSRRRSRSAPSSPSSSPRRPSRPNWGWRHERRLRSESDGAEVLRWPNRAQRGQADERG